MTTLDEPSERVRIHDERRTPHAVLGGLPIAAISRAECADMMIALGRQRQPGRPLFHTSANGEVIARVRNEPDLRDAFTAADLIVADGQPLVLASRLLCRHPLPERVATTDLFHDVAARAEKAGVTFSMFGSTEAENERAVAATRANYPKLRIVHHRHGYLRGDALLRELDAIDAIGPDILWLGMGVPREHRFVREHATRLSNVGLIKTAGGLFNHLTGSRPRAPLWMQRAGFEWLWRTALEPRRLMWRYVSTNPKAIYAMLSDSR